MKPIKTKTFLVQNILIVVSVVLAVLGFILTAKSIPFFPSIEAVTVDGQTNVQVAQGIMPLSNLAFYLSFILIYLMFEFYGFKPAFYTSLNLSTAILLTTGIFILLNRYAINVDESHYDALLSQFLMIRKRAVVGLVLGCAAGFSTALILAASIKRLMRNYFMFIRFPIATAIGFAIFTAAVVYINNVNILAPESMVFEIVTPLSQFLALTIAFIIPLYLLRLFLGIFRGWAKDEPTDTTKGKPMFKGAKSAPVPEEPPIKNQIPAAPPQTQVAEDPKEDTISRKITFNTPSSQNS